MMNRRSNLSKVNDRANGKLFIKHHVLTIEAKKETITTRMGDNKP